MHKKKRDALMQQIKGGVAIFPSAPPAMFNYDTEYHYHQEANFFYLTGFEEPDAICVMAPDHPDHQYILFVRPRNPEKETWTGKRAGLEGAKSDFGADEAYPIESFPEKIHRLKDSRGTSGCRFSSSTIADDEEEGQVLVLFRFV